MNTWQIATYINMPSVREKGPHAYSRLNVRITPEIKARIQRAADLLGQDLTEFTSNTLNHHAQEIIENYEQIVLSEKDFAFFVEALERPAQKPSKRSRKALKEYRQMFGKEISE